MKAYFILRVRTFKCYQILLPKRIRVDEGENLFIDIDSSSNDFISIMKCNIRSTFWGKFHTKKNIYQLFVQCILLLNYICDRYNVSKRSIVRVQDYKLLSLSNKNLLEEPSFCCTNVLCKFDFDFRKTWSIYIFTLVFHICVGKFNHAFFYASLLLCCQKIYTTW